MPLPTLISQDAGPAVALIAQGVIGRAFGRGIRSQQLAFEHGREPGTMRTVGALATRIWPRVAVVTIGAIGQAGRFPRSDQAGHVVVPARSDHRMETLIGRGKCQPFVGLVKLTRNDRRSALHTIPVTPEAKFVFHFNIFDQTAQSGNTGHSGQSAGGMRGGGWGRVGRMGIMAISANGMAALGIDRVFRRIMFPAAERSRMGAVLF